MTINIPTSYNYLVRIIELIIELINLYNQLLMCFIWCCKKIRKSDFRYHSNKFQKSKMSKYTS